MINLLFKIINRFKNLNFISAVKIFYYVLFGNISKYPKYLEKFESKISKKFNSKFSLTFSSGTAAFYASILSLNLEKGSNVLLSRMTFPSVINIVKNLNLKIDFFDVDKNFQPICNASKNNLDYKLIIITHPFGFFCDFTKLQSLMNSKTKLIFDCSHSQGLIYQGKYLNEYSDVTFVSIQGQKAISGGEGGFILTNNLELYEKMIDQHHPGHSKNIYSKNYAGVSSNLKLRMHPLASVIASENIKNFNKRNEKLKKKIKKIYETIIKFENIEIPDFNYERISGFHYGLPFYLKKKKENLVWPVIKYNWPIYEDHKFTMIDEINYEGNFKNLFFIDLNWIKNNSSQFLINNLKLILNDDL